MMLLQRPRLRRSLWQLRRRWLHILLLLLLTQRLRLDIRRGLLPLLLLFEFFHRPGLPRRVSLLRALQLRSRWPSVLLDAAVISALRLQRHGACGCGLACSCGDATSGSTFVSSFDDNTFESTVRFFGTFGSSCGDNTFESTVRCFCTFVATLHTLLLHTMFLGRCSCDNKARPFLRSAVRNPLRSSRGAASSCRFGTFDSSSCAFLLQAAAGPRAPPRG